MRKKIAILLIFLLLSCYMNVFAEMFQKNIRNFTDERNLLYAIATNSQIKKATSSEIKSSEETEVKIEDDIINLSFPANIHAYFDPGNLSGKGQVFSDSYTIKNYGNTDLSIKIKNIDINYWSDEYIYEFTGEKVTATPSQIKKINVDMIWENESKKEKKILKILDSEPNQIVLNLKAAKYDEDDEFIELNDSSIGSFYFTGTLNPNPNFVWEDGEITLDFEYEIISGGLEKENNEFGNDELEIREERKQENDSKLIETMDNDKIENKEQETTNQEIESIIDESVMKNDESFVREIEDLQESREEKNQGDIEETIVNSESLSTKDGEEEKNFDKKEDNQEESTEKINNNDIIVDDEKKDDNKHEKETEKENTNDLEITKDIENKSVEKANIEDNKMTKEEIIKEENGKKETDHKNEELKEIKSLEEKEKEPELVDGEGW